MKYFLISLCFFTLSINAATVPTEQAIELCRAEQNALKRLLCYDAIDSGKVTTNTSSPFSSTAVAAPKTATKADSNADTNANTEQNFGLEHKNKPQNTAGLIYATVTKVSYTSHKELKVEFDNGQQWRQQGSDYYPIAVGEKHHIKRGVFNSFLLGNDNNNRSIKIRREQ